MSASESKFRFNTIHGRPLGWPVECPSILTLSVSLFFRYTPQHNFTEIVAHMKENHLDHPDWGKFFSELKKVIQVE